MSRRQVILLVLLAVLAAVVVWLAVRNPKPPWMPQDPVHAEFVDADTCLACHAPGAPSPQSAAHPVGRDCTRCHGFR